MARIQGQIFYQGRFQRGTVEFGDRITGIAVEKREIAMDSQDVYVIPGLIDLHTHGAVGEDVSDASREGWRRLSRYYASQGVTSWCATTMTLSQEELLDAMKEAKEFRRPRGGAHLLGINLEGPFLSYEKRGSHEARHLQTPSLSLFHRLQEESGGLIRLISVAPELEGAFDWIFEASRECTVALGHTQTDYETAKKAFSVGASHVTHLFNAMSPLHHRNPGLIAAACEEKVTVELIADGYHVHPAMIRLSHQLFEGRIAWISDSLRCAGMPDGRYMLAGQTVQKKEGRATLADSETLAGSCLSLMECLQQAGKWGIPLEDAIKSVTEIPAKILHQEREVGKLERGRKADLVVFNGQYEIVEVYISGEKVFPRD